MRFKIATYLPVLLGFGLLLSACGEGSPGRPGTAVNGARLTSIDGDTIDLAELRGRPVLLNFWSTSCPTCLEEIPRLIALHQDLGDQGLMLVGITMPHDRPDRVVELRHRLQIPYPLVFDPVGALNGEFDTRRITPTHLLISPSGEIVWRRQGRIDFERLKRSITTMLQG